MQGVRGGSAQVGGHHISLSNLVVVGRLVSTTPCFIGADPATTELLGGTLRPLQGPEDTARRLGRSLDADQFRRALSTPAPCPTSSPATGHTSATATR
ncbi:DUF3500 domain-containing protein [Streptomyces canus]|uniref:DUF3500 domain-containing protein n=1 Tax=Streptomyces canus TaxID=58343 RepID=UPI0036AA751E